MLFVELLLIRWAAAHVVYLSYFTNFVLLASFLGIGLGFLRGSGVWFRRSAALLATTITLVALVTVEVASAGGSLRGLFGAPALPAWIVLPAVFGLVAVTMFAIADGVAAAFRRFDALEAYRLDIGGSILGIVAFAILSLVGAPPLVWGLVVAGAFVWLERPLGGRRIAALAALVLVLGVGSLPVSGRWSPYYRVSFADSGDGSVAIEVNGLPHQSMIPVREIEEEGAFYLDPYGLLAGEAPGRVLIVGAGSGNDVAVALAHGATRVDAVEIDRVIQGLGRELHPDRPYDDPRVRPFVDDGRAFLQRTDVRYDLILFALPDSLTLVSGTGSLRLESYLFTVDALEEVRDHLAPGGTFAMYNYYRRDVFERFAATITQAFGQAPCTKVRPENQLGARQQAVLAVGRDPGDLRCDAAGFATVSPGSSVATDDHPFPYLEGRRIPAFYLVTLGAILLASAVAVRRVGGPFRRMWPYADLFLMGAAFLLLETKQVVRFALLFGTTWFVNALVFVGILLAVLAAVEVTRRIALPRATALYAVLAISLVVAWAVPTSALLGLPIVPRFAAATALAFAPVFVANLIFAQRFKDVASSTVAFGANLLGAMAGGVLEYGALVTGYRGLVLAVAAIYGLALLARPRPATPA